MKSSRLSDKHWEQPAADQPERQYVLKLYVSGSTRRSAIAIRNIKQICQEHLAGLYDLQVIDIYQQPALAKGEQIIAVPTLVKKLPAPLHKLIGDLSNTERVLFGLNIKRRTDHERTTQ
jgi:circadian clock protein KaiB